MCEHAAGLAAQLRRQRLGLLAESARDQLRRSCQHRFAVRARERRDDDEHAVLRQPPPVAQCDVVHVADTEAIDEGHAGRDLVDDVRATLGQLDDAAVLGEHDVLLGDAALARELRVRGKHAELSVHRHDGLRT